MQLENQVCSLDLAKRLKELGVKQGGSAFTWVQHYPNGKYKLESFRTQFYGAVTNYHAEGYDSDRHPMYSAFTVAELGEMLPKYIEQVRKNGVSRTGFYLDISFDETSDKWRYSYANHRANECIEMLFDESEADARARMLIYLLENQLIKP